MNRLLAEIPYTAFSILPFAALLFLIAAGPLLFEAFWHKHYKKVAVFTGVLVAAYYILGLQQVHVVAETFAEYISFISLLCSLYVAAGGIYIDADFEAKTTVNILFLLTGAVLANLIGTTGASVLLIRPFMRINRYRLKAYHIVFFIFFVSNTGGLLTPIGDPPLFIGFLKGVPFLWTFENLVPYWCIAMAFLSVVFYLFERKNTQLINAQSNEKFSGAIRMNGGRNFLWLAAIILSVFIDPNTIDGIPYLDMHGKKVSYLRELIQLVITFLCFKTADKKAMDNNRFSFEPIKEVAYLFFGIFLAMMPALKFLEASGKGANLSAGFMYWSTGVFSSMLDNAPTYLNFLTLALTAQGLSVADVNSVRDFVAGNGKLFVEAISVGAVFFGALTYIGNGPNFMVKAIAEEQGVKMPGFFQYMAKYSLPVLLPLFVLIWFFFFS